MLTNFTELKFKASAEKDKSYPQNGVKTGVALLAKDGRIYTGHSVCFSDGHTLDAVDMAVYSALSDGNSKFLAAAFCGNEAPSKAALLRLSKLSDMMVSVNIGQVSADTTLKKLLLQLGENA